MKSKSDWLVAFFGGLLFCLTACQVTTARQPVPEASPTSTATEQPTALPISTQPATRPTASPTLTPTIQPVVLPTAAPLNKAAVNLGGLTSYQATLHLKAQGTQGKQSFEWTYTITQTFRSDTALEVTTLDSTGLGQGQDYSGTVAIQTGKQYLARWSAQSSCAPMSQAQVAGLLLAPGALLPPLGGAQQAGTGQTAGVRAEHYQLAGKDTGVAGDVWLAAPGGYVVQAGLSQDGLLVSLGTDTKGHAEWQYSLESINKPFAPDLPLSCRHLLGDLPLPADATDLSATDNLIHYSTSTALNNLLNLYSDKMKQADWASTSTPTATNDSLRMSFTRQAETAFVNADKTGDQVDVTIVYEGQ